jgi:hypothetical protein
MMSDDLKEVFDPNTVLDEVYPSIEFMGQTAKYRFVSISTEKDTTRYYLELVGGLDLNTVVNRDWTDIKIGRDTIEKGSIIRLKITSKAMKLTFKRHT